MIPDTLFDSLKCGAREAVYKAWLHAHITSSSPIEIDHIHSMTKEGIEELGKQWSPILSPYGIELRITGARLLPPDAKGAL